jgi:hypothetical protein
LASQTLSNLKESYRGHLFNEENKPRLSCARIYFFDLNLDSKVNFDELEAFYKTWRDFDEYLILQRQEWTEKTCEKNTIAVKCSKRGNDVYLCRNKRRLIPILTSSNHTFFDPHANLKKTRALLCTLTYDVKYSSLKEAWDTIGYYANIWITNLRKKYGKISYVRVWEAFFNGYPHVHYLLVFHDYEFITFRYKGKYRIREKAEFEKAYHSFVDVQGVRSLRSGVSYIIKYMTKTYYGEVFPVNESGLRKNLSDMTLAMCWIFRKHSFAVSRDFADLIKHLRNSNRKTLFQSTFEGFLLENEVDWVFLGVKSLVELKSEYPKLSFNDWVVSLS